MSFQNFQVGHHGDNLGYWNGTNVAILNLHVTPLLPTMVGLNPTYRSGAHMVWKFSRWPPWGPSWISEQHDFSNSESLCSSMPPIKFQLNPTYSLGGDVVWRFSRWLTWQPYWKSGRNNFSNSTSPCGPNASRQVWAQSEADTVSRFSRWLPAQAAIQLTVWEETSFERFKMATMASSWIPEWNNFSNSESLYLPLRCLQSSFCSIRPTVWEMSFEEFQDGRHGSHLGYLKGRILAFLNLYNAPMPPITFGLNLTYGLGGDVISRISRWPPCSQLGYRNRMILAILNLCHLCNAPMPPIKFGLNLTYGLGGDVIWRISRWPPCS